MAKSVFVDLAKNEFDLIMEGLIMSLKSVSVDLTKDELDLLYQALRDFARQIGKNYVKSGDTEDPYAIYYLALKIGDEIYSCLDELEINARKQNGEE